MGETKWISPRALVHALAELRSRQIIGNPAIAFIAQKYLGLNENDYTEYKSGAAGGHKTEFFIPYLMVSQGPDTPRYYLPFDGVVTPGGPSEYSHGSVYSPWRELRKDYIRDVIEWEDASPSSRNYNAKYKNGYIEALASKMFGKTDGEKRIPLASLAVFLQSRKGLVDGEWTIEDATNSWKEALHLTKEEMDSLFDIDLADWPSPEFVEDEVTDAQVVATIVAQARVSTRSSTGISGEPVAPPGGDWDISDVPTALVGLEGPIQQAMSALKAGKHVVLIGPPGTGKTTLAEQIASVAKEKGIIDGYRIATATSEWTTFETIGGYMPDVEDSGKLSFQPGLITETLEDGDWLVLDELNRADLDKAFGELFTVLSGNPVWLPFKTADSKRYVLTVAGETFDRAQAIEISPTWRIIATMNTADKASLFQLSYALMRRFAFISVPSPGEAEYRELITNSWTGRTVLSEHQELLDVFYKMFLPESGLLAGIGIRVGPAIVIDMIKYLEARLSDETVFEGKNQVAMKEATEMYLLPQFEGMDAYHSALLDALAEGLNLEESLKTDLEDTLSLWTGFQPS